MEEILHILRKEKEVPVRTVTSYVGLRRNHQFEERGKKLERSLLNQSATKCFNRGYTSNKG